MTNGDYQKINNVNRDIALLDLRELISKGIIKAQGLGSGTYYIVKEYLIIEVPLAMLVALLGGEPVCM